MRMSLEILILNSGEKLLLRVTGFQGGDGSGSVGPWGTAKLAFLVRYKSLSKFPRAAITKDQKLGG